MPAASLETFERGYLPSTFATASTISCSVGNASVSFRMTTLPSTATS
ncbi:hypothetical protein JY651_46225 [Pyxidicoccus parkwayensis]|uniref:Uncharacterized protein n=1 Tax=Pyxidicoccus parkwayensis TaxID=2813578 RepID=A0ABX7NU82_9BACT|nr:hypothetical protein JY651_46225 [Pyxidicoccus parkwaysis]